MACHVGPLARLSSQASTAAALALLALPGLSTPSRAQLARTEKATLEVVADRTAYDPGGEAEVAAVMTIEAGWHTNSHWPSFEYLIATQVRFELPEGWPEAVVDYPAGEMKSFSFAEEPLSV